MSVQKVFIVIVVIVVLVIGYFVFKGTAKDDMKTINSEKNTYDNFGDVNDSMLQTKD